MLSMIFFSADFGVSAQITATLSKRKSFIGSPYWSVYVMYNIYISNINSQDVVLTVDFVFRLQDGS